MTGFSRLRAVSARLMPCVLLALAACAPAGPAVVVPVGGAEASRLSLAPDFEPADPTYYRARARIEGPFNFRHTAEKTLALYRRLLEPDAGAAHP